MAKKNGKNKKGFTLIELLLSMAIFTIVIFVVVGIFGRMFLAYRNTRVIQQNLEKTQYALSLMAKSMRGSTILTPAISSSPSVAIKFYDYSQGKCLRYDFYNSSVVMYEAKDSSGANASVSACVNTGLVNIDHTPIASNATMQTVISSGVTGKFSFSNSCGVSYANNSVTYAGNVNNACPSGTPVQVGKVTIIMQVCPDAGCSGPANLNVNMQTTVSLRDYIVSGL